MVERYWNEIEEKLFNREGNIIKTLNNNLDYGPKKKKYYLINENSGVLD